MEWGGFVGFLLGSGGEGGLDVMLDIWFWMLGGGGGVEGLGVCASAIWKEGELSMGGGRGRAADALPWFGVT